MPLSRSSTARRSSNVAVPRLVIVSASCTRCGSKVKTLGAELEPEPECHLHERLVIEGKKSVKIVQSAAPRVQIRCSYNTVACTRWLYHIYT